MNRFVAYSHHVFDEIFYIESKDEEEAKEKLRIWDWYEWSPPGMLSWDPDLRGPEPDPCIVERFRGKSWPGDQARRVSEREERRDRRRWGKLDEKIDRGEELLPEDFEPVEMWLERLTRVWRFKLWVPLRERVSRAITDVYYRRPRLRSDADWYSPPDGEALNRYAVHCRECELRTIYIEARGLDEAREIAYEPTRLGYWPNYAVPGIVSRKEIFVPLKPRVLVEKYEGEVWPPAARR